MENNLSLFDRSKHTEFNQDYVVLCHELGHIITWLCYGEEIISLTCKRSDTDNLLEPHVKLRPPNDQKELLDSPNYVKQYAEHLLAGEISARRACGKLTIQICSKGLPVGADSKQLRCFLQQKIDEKASVTNEDIFKVLCLAFKNAKSDWYAWIGERMKCAGAIVDQNWAAIDQIARRLEPSLPATGKSHVWTKDELIAEIMSCGINLEKC